MENNGTLWYYIIIVYLEEVTVAFPPHLRRWRWHPHFSSECGGASPISYKKDEVASSLLLRWWKGIICDAISISIKKVEVQCPILP